MSLNCKAYICRYTFELVLLYEDEKSMIYGQIYSRYMKP